MSRRTLFAAALLLAMAWNAVAVFPAAKPKSKPRPSPTPSASAIPHTMLPLKNERDLQTYFAAADGHPRLLLFFSPTCPVCLEGVAWLHDALQNEYKSLPIKVLAVWLPVMPEDSRDEAEAVSLALKDPRVTRLWDPTARTGYFWLQKVVADMPGLKNNWVFGRGLVFDAYFLFDAAARWKGDAPPQPLAGGASVWDERDHLRGHLNDIK